jgi:uncharacterized repeat protein (TIGR01451 family)
MRTTMLGADMKAARRSLWPWALLAAMAALVGGWLLWPPAARAGYNDYCYTIGGASTTTGTDGSLILVRIMKYETTSSSAPHPGTNTAKSDSATFQPGAGILFTVNTRFSLSQGWLGTMDLATGQFTPRANPLGTAANGSLGPQTFFDISGLTFDPGTGKLYGVHVRTGSTSRDLLFQINPSTGQYVPGAFVNGADYVEIPFLSGFSTLTDIDDIAIDPATGQMYGIINHSSAVYDTGDRLIKIDKVTGQSTDVGAFGVGEVEGLSFDVNGNLWVTSGGDTQSNKLYPVNKATGAVDTGNARTIPFLNNYEALACMTQSVDLQLTLSDNNVTAYPGGTVAYTLSYNNAGSQAATGVALTNTLPAGTSFVAAGSTAGWQQVSGSTYRLSVGNLSVGQSGQATLVVQVGAGQSSSLLDTAGITNDGAASGYELYPGDNTSSDSTPLGSAPTASPTPKPGTTPVPTAPPGNTRRIYLPSVRK